MPFLRVFISISREEYMAVKKKTAKKKTVKKVAKKTPKKKTSKAMCCRTAAYSPR